MEIPYYQVNAFTKSVFGGNPAGVCPLEDWLDDETIQAVDRENNLSETAFFVKRQGYYELRWFTPMIEVDLCGHATLASAFVIFNYLDKSAKNVKFETKSGILIVTRKDDLLVMDFPTRVGISCDVPADLVDGLGRKPKEVLSSIRDYLVVYDSKDVIESLQPDMDKLSRLDRLCIIVTAPGLECDFVLRFFAPRGGVPEDPVTGSSHCTLVPYWSERLGRKQLHAFQVSQRSGGLFCRDLGDRVEIAGYAAVYLKAAICL